MMVTDAENGLDGGLWEKTRRALCIPDKPGHFCIDSRTEPNHLTFAHVSIQTTPIPSRLKYFPNHTDPNQAYLNIEPVPSRSTPVANGT